jgi:hypothetical protein
MAKGLNYERRMRLADRFSKPAPKATSYNRFGRGIRDRELDTPTKVFGEVAKDILPNPAMIKQAVQDPTGTALGAVEVASLASPIANAYRAYNLLSGGDFSVTGAGMEDVEQFAELASLIPSAKAVKAVKPVARIAPNVGKMTGRGVMNNKTVSILEQPSQREAAYNAEQTLRGSEQAGILSGIDVPFRNTGNNAPALRPLTDTAEGVASKTKASKTRQLSDSLKSPVVKVQKARAAGDPDPPKITGQQQRSFEHGTLILRTERANARARDKGDAGVLKILDEKNQLDAATKKEFDRLIADAERNYPEIWNDQGIEGFDFSHRTSLGTPDNVSNVWSNIELLPRKVNVDQSIAPWSAFRSGDIGIIKRFGGQGRGTQVVVPRP